MLSTGHAALTRGAAGRGPPCGTASTGRRGRRPTFELRPSGETRRRSQPPLLRSPPLTSAQLFPRASDPPRQRSRSATSLPPSRHGRIPLPAPYPAAWRRGCTPRSGSTPPPSLAPWPSPPPDPRGAPPAGGYSTAVYPTGALIPSRRGAGPPPALSPLVTAAERPPARRAEPSGWLRGEAAALRGGVGSESCIACEQ